MSSFHFELTDEAIAREFWEDSPHGSVFTHPDVLSRLACKVDWWLARKGREAMCLWPVCLDLQDRVRLPGFTYYVGPMWSRTGCDIPAHRWLADSLQIYQGLTASFLERYEAIHAQLPLGLLDVRAFDWWNYHQPEKPRFQIKAKYTACIKCLQEMDKDKIFSGFRELRRREIRRAEKLEDLESVRKWDKQDVIKLYAEVLNRQGFNISGQVQDWIAQICELASSGWGELVGFQDSEGKELVSAVLLLRAKGVSNMVLNVAANKWRDSGLSAWVMHQAILTARKRGDHVFDFNGANSPRRGDDKHSYGAEPELFFEIEYP